MIPYPHVPKRLVVALLAALLLRSPLLASGDVKIIKDVVYGTIPQAKPSGGPLVLSVASDPDDRGEVVLKLDVYEPDNLQSTRPGIIVVHGGGWFSGDKANPFYVDQCRMLAEKGFVA